MVSALAIQALTHCFFKAELISLFKKLICLLQSFSIILSCYNLVRWIVTLPTDPSVVFSRHVLHPNQHEYKRPVRWLISGLISPAGAGLLWEENTIGWLISPGWNQQANMLKIVKIHESTTDINMYVYYIKSTTDINTSWWSLHFCLLVTCYSVILRENPTRSFAPLTKVCGRPFCLHP